MTDREAEVIDAAIRVIAKSGLRGLTYRAVDTEAGLPSGATSNCFRTRSALIRGVVRRMGDLEILDLAPRGQELDETHVSGAFGKWSSEGFRQTVARFELMIESLRSPEIAEALKEQRERFVAVTESFGGTEGIPLTSRQLVALMTGLQFAELTTGESVLDDILNCIRDAQTGGNLQ